MRDDFRTAAASATDDLWRRANEAKRQAETEEARPFDPDCRFGAVDVEHRCSDPFGAPVREGGTCFYEANAQMHDQERRRRFDERAQREFIAASGLDKALVERLYPECLNDQSQEESCP